MTKGSTIIIALIITWVIIIALGAGGYWFYQSKKTSTPSPSPSLAQSLTPSPTTSVSQPTSPTEGQQSTGQQGEQPKSMPKPVDAKQGPYYHKIYSATSLDGLTWTKTNNLLFDHASVPGAIIKDGTIYLYFVDASSGEEEHISVAISKDNGKTYDKKTVVVKDQSYPVDPNPVLLADGRIRLYYFGNFGDLSAKTHTFYSAVSSDGINFDQQTKTYEDSEITDPDVFQISANKWKMYVSKGKKLSPASSADGLTFTADKDMGWENGSVSSTYKFGDKFRTYYCGEGGIASATSTDGTNLQVESGTRLTAEKNQIICDPTIIQLPDKTYVMYYKIQETNALQKNRVT